ncbi:lactoylglutathione lyase GLX1-like isoform X1 [Juglans microcarpa x Juglans regia]|uniref:lactoylglutathione lyase GLX1-like isoform X1 n=1 Tax=Juglans microcarpa x Juglans regia TaxID=2249226 RepID=UPI001B7EFF61|nr:lactoylglutathione lyase GLX1-like isoform X1 [Juglans microcarpa x Juglans regia]
MAIFKQFAYSVVLFLSLIGSSMAARIPSDDVLGWVKKDNHRFLHADIRVGDLNRTIKFYTESLGMKLLSQKYFPKQKYSKAVVGFGPQDTHFVLEFTCIHGVEKYEIGTAFGHIGIATQDIYAMVENIRAKGGVITREPAGLSTIYAFGLDPDGYSYELIQSPPTPEPISQIMLHVADLDRAIKFYEKALGMNLLQKYDSQQEQFTLGMVGYGSNLTRTTVLELKYNYNVTEYTRGNGYAEVAIGTDNVYKSAAAVKLVTKELGGQIILPPGPIPQINTKITSFVDPEGFKTDLVDNKDYLKEVQKKE